MGATPRLPQSSRPHGPALLPAQQCPQHPPDSASPAKAKRKPTPTFSCRSSEPLPKERSQNAALHQSTDAVLQQKDYQHAATLLPGVRLQTKSRTSVTRAMNAPTPPTGRLPLAHPPSDGATRRCTADSAAAADEAALCGSALSNPLKKARSRSERRGKAKQSTERGEALEHSPGDAAQRTEELFAVAPLPSCPAPSVKCKGLQS